MGISETLRLVWLNILESKGKAVLTSLGIIVGSATIIMVIAIGKGGEAEVQKQFENLSAATLYVTPNYSNSIQADNKDYPRITEENLQFFIEDGNAIKDLALYVNSYKTIQLGGEEIYTPVTASTSNFFTIANLDLVAGDIYTQEDMDVEARVVVIGHELANKNFASPDDAIGSDVYIENRRYKIVGVLSEKGDGIQGQNPDETIYVPYSTGLKYVHDEYSIPQIMGLANDVKQVPAAMEQLASAMDYLVENSHLLSLSDAGSRIDAATESSRTMTTLLMSVSVIVFIVGGIGIMNVLLVSVKERTKEIGILKALGSSQKNILISFLLEATAISLFGGTVGVVSTLFIMPLMKYTDLPVVPSVTGAVVAVLFAVITGIGFGFYPAYQASKLNPIEALNRE